jgi:hypothetical protein
VEGAAARGSRTVDPLGADRARLRLDLEVDLDGDLEAMADDFQALLQATLDGDIARLRTQLEDGTSTAAA